MAIKAISSNYNQFVKIIYIIISYSRILFTVWITHSFSGKSLYFSQNRIKPSTQGIPKIYNKNILPFTIKKVVPQYSVLFSLNRSTWPFQSLSCNVCLCLSVFLPLFGIFVKGILLPFTKVASPINQKEKYFLGKFKKGQRSQIYNFLFRNGKALN